jgi:hypothetical protein
MPFGVAQLQLNSTEVAQKLYGGIAEYIGCAEPLWLD